MCDVLAVASVSWQHEEYLPSTWRMAIVSTISVTAVASLHHVPAGVLWPIAAKRVLYGNNVQPDCRGGVASAAASL